MDNPTFMPRITDSSASIDYQTIHNMLQGCVDFKYTQQHIFSDGLIKLIIAELEYWHNKALRASDE